MPGIEPRNETEDEEMDQDTMDSYKSEEEDEEFASGSDDDDSSVIDEVECERRRNECLLDMMELEKQFTIVREQLYAERLFQVEMQLKEAKEGTSQEYLVPLAEIERNRGMRVQVAEILRQYRIQNIKHVVESEVQASHQHYESEKSLLYDHVKNDLEEKIRRLEEDRHNIDLTSDLWGVSQADERKKKKNLCGNDRRKKAVTISGPYIVYMLEESDIIDDWTTIMKTMKQTHRRKDSDYSFRSLKHQYQARFEDGKLYYDGDFYSKGHHIIIDNKLDSPEKATVTAINAGEVHVRRPNGSTIKLYIDQLQKGKYTIRHVVF